MNDGDVANSNFLESYDFVKEHYKSLNKASNFAIKKIDSDEGTMDPLDKFLSSF